MIEINLLPKEYKKRSSGFSLGKAGVYALAGVAGVIVIMLSITFYQMHQLSELHDNMEKAQQRAALLRSDIRVVDALLDVKNKIQNRMSAVERLDRYRSSWVRILEDVARNVPEFVWLNKFSEVERAPVVKKPDKKKSGDSDEEETKEMRPNPALEPVHPVEIKGFAFTLNSLAAFMIKMMRSDYFDDVKLQETMDTTFTDERAYTFMLTANVHYLSSEDQRQNVAAAGQSGSKADHASLN